MSQLSILKASLLGALQGATEFLPVSSSGHLVLAQHFLGVELEGGQLLAFDVCLHFGTLLAVIFVFWRELAGMITAIFAPKMTTSVSAFSPKDSRRLFLFLVIATIPAGLIGVLFEDFFDGLFGNPLSASFMLIITGVILWFTKYIKGDGLGVERIGLTRSLIIGFSQALAIIPGISRSGSTISAAIYSGLNRDLAARFSFLLAVPAILGASILKIGDLSELSKDNLIAVVIGTAISCAVGVAAIKGLLAIIRRRSFHWFAVYCWVAGISSMIYLLLK
ncbi:MAG: undecaprenyl-diphosphate phosphatase [Pseudomonadota bacterium]